MVEIGDVVAITTPQGAWYGGVLKGWDGKGHAIVRASWYDLGNGRKPLRRAEFKVGWLLKRDVDPKRDRESEW